MAAERAILVFGSINLDLVARVDAIARPGETVLSPRADSFFGGKGANQAVAAARVAQGTGITVAMAGAIGQDPFGEACLKNLKDNGIDTRLVRTVSEPTGCAFITVDQRGENAITVASGANMALQASQLGKYATASPALIVLQMEVSLEQNLAAARWAKDIGAKVLWNLAPAPSAQERGRLDELLAVADLLVVNEHEALAVAASLGRPEVGRSEEAAAFLARSYGLTCIVTIGAQGAIAFEGNGNRTAVPAPPIAPIDTTGAGDTFVGVLAASLAEGLTLEVSMERACLAASQACLVLGAQAGMPWREALGKRGPES
jgi:Sugar kinases, ribokinase family